VSKRMLLIGLLVVVVALLSGCEILDNIIGGITGGGTTGPAPITSVGISYHLDVTLSEREIKPKLSGPVVTTSAGSVGMVIGPKAGTYYPESRTFIATWDNQVGDFSNTRLEVQLNETEEYVEYYILSQTQSNVWFAWTFVNEISGLHILNLNHETDNPRIYEVQGTDAHIPISKLTHKGWSTAGGDFTDPLVWINSQADIIPSLNNIITIEVYR